MFSFGFRENRNFNKDDPPPPYGLIIKDTSNHKDTQHINHQFNMTAGTGTKFYLLFKKNWIIQKRKICCTITEILIPVVLSLLLLALRQAITAKDKDVSRWDEFSIEELPDGLYPLRPEAWKLAYTPDNALTRSLMNRVASQLGLDVTGESMINCVNIVYCL